MRITRIAANFLDRINRIQQDYFLIIGCNFSEFAANTSALPLGGTGVPLLCRNLFWGRCVCGGMKAAKGSDSAQLIEKVVDLAMRLGRRHLADYGAARSRHDFTQRQLMSCLILRA
jgi:hypothetical protein